MKVLINNIDVSTWIEKITWSGDKNQIARKLSFTVAYSRQDDNIPALQIDNGNTVTLIEQAVLFQGVIINISRQENSTTLSVSAVDLAWYTGKIKTYGIYEGTAATITRQVCAEYGIETGSLLDISGNKEIISTGDKTIYQVIADAYADADWCLHMDGSALHIYPAGAEVVARLSGDSNVMDASYTSSIENMINKVVVLDGDAAYAGEVKQETHISQYGLMQETYKAETGKDARQEALKLLKGIEETGSVTAIGNLACITGRAVYITEVSSNITGRFCILSDSHTFDGGLHTMSLGLEFKGVM